MYLANLGDQRLPLCVETRSPIAALRLLDVRQSRMVVLALARVDDTHALRAEEFRRNAWMGFGEPLRRGLGGVMTQTLQLGVAGTFQTFGETSVLLRTEQ